MMHQLMALIDNAFNMCGMRYDDVSEVTVRWKARNGVITYRIQIGIYTIGWRLEF